MKKNKHFILKLLLMIILSTILIITIILYAIPQTDIDEQITLLIIGSTFGSLATCTVSLFKTEDKGIIDKETIKK